MNTLARFLPLHYSSNSREFTSASLTPPPIRDTWGGRLVENSVVPFQRRNRENTPLYSIKNPIVLRAPVPRERLDEDILRDLLRCVKRLWQLAGIEDGWYDGAGRRPTRKALISSGEFLEHHMILCGAFSICPTPRGGIMFEFDWRGWDYSVEVNSAGCVMLYGMEIEGNGEIEPEQFVPLNDDFHSLVTRVMGADDTWKGKSRTVTKNSIVKSIHIS